MNSLSERLILLFLFLILLTPFFFSQTKAFWGWGDDDDDDSDSGGIFGAIGDAVESAVETVSNVVDTVVDTVTSVVSGDSGDGDSSDDGTSSSSPGTGSSSSGSTGGSSIDTSGGSSTHDSDSSNGDSATTSSNDDSGSTDNDGSNDYDEDDDDDHDYYSGGYDSCDSGDCNRKDGYIGSRYCSGGDVKRDYEDYYCSGGDCESKIEERTVENCGSDEKCESGDCVLEFEIESVTTNAPVGANEELEIEVDYQGEGGIFVADLKDGNEKLTCGNPSGDRYDCEDKLTETDFGGEEVTLDYLAPEGEEGHYDLTVGAWKGEVGSGGEQLDSKSAGEVTLRPQNYGEEVYFCEGYKLKKKTRELFSWEEETEKECKFGCSAESCNDPEPIDYELEVKEPEAVGGKLKVDLDLNNVYRKYYGGHKGDTEVIISLETPETEEIKNFDLEENKEVSHEFYLDEKLPRGRYNLKVNIKDNVADKRVGETRKFHLDSGCYYSKQEEVEEDKYLSGYNLADGFQRIQKICKFSDRVLVQEFYKRGTVILNKTSEDFNRDMSLTGFVLLPKKGKEKAFRDLKKIKSRFPGLKASTLGLEIISAIGAGHILWKQGILSKLPRAKEFKETGAKVRKGWWLKLEKAGCILSNIGKKIKRGAVSIYNNPSKTGNRLVNFLKSSILSLAKGVDYIIHHPVKSVIKGNQLVLNALVRGGQAYLGALKDKPVDTLAKTSMTFGGLLAAGASIATGVGAPAGAAIGGATLGQIGLTGSILSAGGAATMFGQESYEFATAKNIEELKKDAKEDPEDLLWLGGAALDTYGGIKAWKYWKGVSTSTKNMDEILKGLDELETEAWGGNPKIVEEINKNTRMKIKDLREAQLLIKNIRPNKLNTYATTADFPTSKGITVVVNEEEIPEEASEVILTHEKVGHVPQWKGYGKYSSFLDDIGIDNPLTTTETKHIELSADSALFSFYNKDEIIKAFESSNRFKFYKKQFELTRKEVLELLENHRSSLPWFVRHPPDSKFSYSSMGSKMVAIREDNRTFIENKG